MLAGRLEVQQLSEGASERDALQEIYTSVQELQHNLRSEVQRLHLDVRQLKDRVNHMALQRRASGHL
jgi:predicted metalloenzyme YecM